MKVFIQREGGEFSNINYLTSFLGFREMGYETEFFEWNRLDQLPITQETVVHGGIRAVVQALAKLGHAPSALPSLPQSLARFAKRRTWTTTLAEVRERMGAEHPEPIFIKPLASDRKLFTGQVLRQFRDLLDTVKFPAELTVECSEVVNFVSEYRAFVLRGEVIGFKNYKGDFRLFPDFKVVDEAVAEFADAPVAYALDVGLTELGETLLVEVNDSFSLGCYGLSPIRYAKMIEQRWNELVGLN